MGNVFNKKGTIWCMLLRTGGLLFYNSRELNFEYFPFFSD